MKLRYVGHKPIISYKGVDFSGGKEDKYIYIEGATQMLNFLSGVDSNLKIMINPKKKLDEKEVLNTLYRRRPDFEQSYKNHIVAYEKKLLNQIVYIDKRKNLGEIEKDIFKKNLNHIKEYRLQRATNKIVYEELIKGCVTLIQEQRVREINMPFSHVFVHIAESFAKTLTLVNQTNKSQIEIVVDKNQPYKHLSVKFTVLGQEN